MMLCKNLQKIDFAYVELCLVRIRNKKHKKKGLLNGAKPREL
jgi:hypothetical protein